jgi:hypothetical protein
MDMMSATRFQSRGMNRFAIFVIAKQVRIWRRTFRECSTFCLHFLIDQAEHLEPISAAESASVRPLRHRVPQSAQLPMLSRRNLDLKQSLLGWIFNVCQMSVRDDRCIAQSDLIQPHGHFTAPLRKPEQLLLIVAFFPLEAYRSSEVQATPDARRRNQKFVNNSRTKKETARRARDTLLASNNVLMTVSVMIVLFQVVANKTIRDRRGSRFEYNFNYKSVNRGFW